MQHICSAWSTNNMASLSRPWVGWYYVGKYLGLFSFFLPFFFFKKKYILMDRCKCPHLTWMRLDTQPTCVHTYLTLAWPGRWGGYMDRCVCAHIQLTWSRWCGMILGDFFFFFFLLLPLLTWLWVNFLCHGNSNMESELDSTSSGLLRHDVWSRMDMFHYHQLYVLQQWKGH